ncbi:hypothetical protein [Mycoplasmoides pirum]|uniref:hypothetical protein n=1 Tax=Mycoplasmoides pirum TaxID=2122 RepID=UPI00048558AD|nr:hypothetical protein [Mycoplasmoides pirum]
MKFIICSKNFDIYFNKWVSFAEKNPDLNFIFINDSGDSGFLIKDKLHLKNVLAIDNKNNIGKVKSFLNLIIDNKINDWLFMVDDKDELLLNSNELIELSQSSLDKNFVYVADNLVDINSNKIIGDNFIDNHKSLSYFYFKKGKIGDKFLLINSEIILNNELWYKTFLNFENQVFETALLSKYYDLPTNKIKPVICHKYTKEGISNNNLNVKLDNAQYYVWESHFILNKKPSFKIVIVKLFILWWLRKNNNKISNLSLLNKIIYCCLKFSFVFWIIRKIYIKKLNQVINSK